jgi:hypothetical protein
VRDGMLDRMPRKDTLEEIKAVPCPVFGAKAGSSCELYIRNPSKGRAF